MSRRVRSGIVIAVTAAGCWSGRASTPAPAPASTPPAATEREDAAAFARRFVARLGGPDEELLPEIDIRANLVAAGCLYAAIDDLTQWCGSFRELDQLAGDAAVRAAQRRVLDEIRARVSPTCTFAHDGEERVARSPRRFGTLHAITGETDASRPELERYQRFIASIADERALELDCDGAVVKLFVVRFQGEGYRAYGVYY